MITGTVSLRELLERPVMLDDIRLGAPIDAVLDAGSLRVVGLEVECGDGARRFLPLGAARIRGDRLAVGSALMLLEENVRDFYRRRSSTFSALVGLPVERAGRPLGRLVDLVIGPDGTTESVCVRANGSREHRHPRAGIVLGRARRVPAA
ncbi:MAG TPA: hypothetical protein VGQ15_15570 [Gaiellaceae bacterium]|nr:hypothetical protein [Gaiellaceae bacterium]